MKIILNNFKSWSNKQLDFGNNQFVLLSGKSGIGKTSILDAIIFVLFGIGQKIVKIGEKTCSVKLEWPEKNLILKRTKKPNRLTLTKNDNTTLEDEVAQHYINNIMGDKTEFSGYIKQGMYKTFITMSPTEKLEYLEQMLFENENINDKKGIIKLKIKEINDELLKIRGQISAYSEDKIEEPGKVEFPIECKNIEKGLENHKIKVSNNEIKQKKCNKNLDKLNLKLKLTRSYEKTKEEYLQRTDKLEEEIRQHNSNFDKDLYISFKKEIKELESKREKFYENQENMNLRSMLDDYKSKYKTEKEKVETELDTKINKLTKKLWKESSQEDTNEYIIDLEESKEDCLKITKLEKEINDIQDKSEIKGIQDNKTYITELISKQDSLKIRITEIKLLLKRADQKFKCPKCESYLNMQPNGDLELCQENNCGDGKEDLQQELNSFKKELLEDSYINKLQVDFEIFSKKKIEIDNFKNNYEDELDLDDINQELKDSRDYLEKNLNYQSKIEELTLQLKSEHLNDYLSSLHKEITNIESKIQNEDLNGDGDIESAENIENIKERLTYCKTKFDKLSDLNKKIDDSEFKLEHITSEFGKCEEKFLEENGKYITSKSLLKHFEKNETEKEDLINEKDKLDKIDNKIGEYNDYIKELQIYEKYIQKIENVLKNEKELEEKLTAFNILKLKVLEAESICIKNVINMINVNVQNYLDIYFKESLNVEINSFKSSTSKPQINLSILNKDDEMDLNMVSGGELQRIIIAFNLVLCDIFNCPFLLLDECTSNLDKETTEIIVESIKDNFPNKTIILVAHQVVSGMFDEVIQF